MRALASRTCLTCEFVLTARAAEISASCVVRRLASERSTLRVLETFLLCRQPSTRSPFSIPFCRCPELASNPRQSPVRPWLQCRHLDSRVFPRTHAVGRQEDAERCEKSYLSRVISSGSGVVARRIRLIDASERSGCDLERRCEVGAASSSAFVATEPSAVAVETLRKRSKLKCQKYQRCYASTPAQRQTVYIFLTPSKGPFADSTAGWKLAGSRDAADDNEHAGDAALSNRIRVARKAFLRDVPHNV